MAAASSVHILSSTNMTYSAVFNLLTAATRGFGYNFFSSKWRWYRGTGQCITSSLASVYRGPGRTLPAKWGRYPDPRFYT